MQDLQDVTISELSLFADLARTKSIRELARRRQVSPSYISKVMKRLEGKTHQRLIDRTLSGVILTTEGQNLLEHVEKLMKVWDSLQTQGGVKNQSRRVFGVGGASFIINHLLVPVLSRIESSTTNYRFRLLEVPPDQYTSAGLRSAFEICFHFGKIDWPQTWRSELVGKIRWSLCCRSGHELLKRKISNENILEYPFTTPTYWTPEGLSSGNDGCPVPLTRRKQGHETSTAEAAIALVRKTNDLAFLPDILIEPYVKSGEVEKIHVRSWKDVSKSLYVSVRTDIVPDKLLRSLLETTKKILPQ